MEVIVEGTPMHVSPRLIQLIFYSICFIAYLSMSPALCPFSNPSVLVTIVEQTSQNFVT